MNLNEVAPPGWGHTKAEKEKTKPNKPKSKIGGSAAAFKRALDDGRFKGLPGDKTKKEKTASMFKLMWSMKNKGDKPHYKPGTDEKKKKYQDESFGEDVEYNYPNVRRNPRFSTGSKMSMKPATGIGAKKSTKNNPDGDDIRNATYNQIKKLERKKAAQRRKSASKILAIKKMKEDWKPEIEHVKGSDLRKKAAEKKRKAAADSLPPHLKLDVMK